MKILLTIPPSNIEEQYGSLAKAAPELPPLGLAFIAKYMRQRGIEVDIHDFSVEKSAVSRFFTDIKDYDVVGMPVFITTVPDVVNFAKLIRQKNPKAVIVAGGPHATLFAGDLFLDCIDVIMKGEGEAAFYEIVNEIAGGSADFSRVKGIYFRKGKDFTFTGERDLYKDIDGIGAPLIEKFELSSYYPPIHVLGKKVVHTLTSRGCPYDCRFCAATEIFKGKIRFRSVDNVMEELKKYSGMGYDSLMFYDDSFTINRKRAIELCKKMRDAKLGMKWMCFTRADLVDKELLSYMKEAGCYLITFGCESGNDKTLALLKKEVTSETNYKGIKLTREAGILAASTFMMGLPGENYADMERTIEFAKNSDLSFAYFPIFEPYKGTPIFDICKETGKWIKDSNHKNSLLEFQEEIWVPDGITRKEIEALAKKAFKEFYFRYNTIISLLYNTVMHLPARRKMRFAASGIDFFLMKNFRKTPKRVGSRYC